MRELVAGIWGDVLVKAEKAESSVMVITDNCITEIAAEKKNP